MFVGSDALALGPLTDRITYLEEGDFAVITRTSVEITDAAATASRVIRTVRPEQALVDKGGYRHFMAKEIAERLPSSRALSTPLPQGWAHRPARARLDFTALTA